jgi:CubicO group peptidase (beta-lactamase class C family)
MPQPSKSSLLKAAQAASSLVVIAMQLSSSQAAPSGADAGAGSIAAALQPFVDSHEMAGAVTLVSTRTKDIDITTVGYADLATKAPMTKDTLFWIASMSKPMATTAFMMLVDEGKVKLDDPVEKYLPEFHGQMYIAEKDENHELLKKPTHPITIRNILSHTAGLPPVSPIEHPTFDLLPLAIAVRSHAASPLKYDPGMSYEYSNAGINTAGRIIEVVSGMPYEKFLQERLFDPLGMKDTVWIPNEEQVSRLAKSYKATASGLQEIEISQLHYPLTDPNRHAFPAGGLFSTASDVAKFGRMILNGGVYNGRRFLSEAAIAEMTKKQTGDHNKAPYGFGWGIDGSRFGHGGAYKTNLSINPQLGMVTVFMVQQGSDWPTEAGKKILPTFENAAVQLLISTHAYMQKPTEPGGVN